MGSTKWREGGEAFPEKGMSEDHGHLRRNVNSEGRGRAGIWAEGRT